MHPLPPPRFSPRVAPTVYVRGAGVRLGEVLGKVQAAAGTCRQDRRALRAAGELPGEYLVPGRVWVPNPAESAGGAAAHRRLLPVPQGHVLQGVVWLHDGIYLPGTAHVPAAQAGVFFFAQATFRAPS